MHVSCDKCGSTPANACDDGTSQCKECRKVTGAQLMEVPAGRRRASKKAEQAAKVRKASKAKAKDGRRIVNSDIKLESAKIDVSAQVTADSHPHIDPAFRTALIDSLDIQPVEIDDISSAGIAEYQSQSRPPMGLLTEDMLDAARGLPTVKEMILEQARKRGLDGARTMEARDYEINPRFHPRLNWTDAEKQLAGRTCDAWPVIRTGRDHLFDYIEQRKELAGSAHIKAALDGMSRLLHAAQSDFNADVADAVGDICLALHSLCATRDLWLDQCVDSNLVAWAAKQEKTKEKQQ